MTFVKYSNVARDRHGTVIANVKILVDYNSGTANRTAALIKITNWGTLAGDSVTLDPSDASLTTWEEGTDFIAETSNSVTAQNLASTINGTTNYTASAIGTGHDGYPYVSVVYTASGYISSTSLTGSSSWNFVTLNADNDTIAKVASDDSGTIKHQPIWTNSDGLFQFYIDAPVDIDINASKSGKDFDNTYTEDITVAT